MTTATCIECAGPLAFEHDLLLGEVAQCPDCGVELEVVGLTPLSFDLAPEVEEDWGE